jgi:hypothetical protein
MKKMALGFLVIVILGIGAPQKTTDFTRSPTEHLKAYVDQPFVVRSVTGFVTLERAGDPLAHALVEIQGPAEKLRIRRATTDEHGRFGIRHVPHGSYKFKVTLGGYQSVLGTITVSRSASGDNKIRIEMAYGV